MISRPRLATQSESDVEHRTTKHVLTKCKEGVLEAKDLLMRVLIYSFVLQCDGLQRCMGTMARVVIDREYCGISEYSSFGGLQPVCHGVCA
jgi:hypothetical protein